MLLRDLQLPLTDADAKAFALVFGEPLAVRLAELHAEWGTENCVPVPVALVDGRLMLSADVLTEVQPGGLLAAMWSHADQGIVSASVEVMPWADAVAMLPPAEPVTGEP